MATLHESYMRLKHELAKLKRRPQTQSYANNVEEVEAAANDMRLAATASADELARQLELSLKDAIVLKEQRDASEREFRAAEDGRLKAGDQLAKLCTSLNSMHAAMSDKRGRIHDLESQLGKARKEVATLEHTCREIEEIHRREVILKNRTIEELEGKLDKATRPNPGNVFDGCYRAADGEIRAAQLETERAKQAAKEHQERAAKLEAQLASSIRTNEKLSDRLNIYDAELGQYIAAYDKLRKSHSSAIAGQLQSYAKSVQLTKQVETQAATIRALREQADQINRIRSIFEPFRPAVASFMATLDGVREPKPDDEAISGAKPTVFCMGRA